MAFELPKIPPPAPPPLALESIDPRTFLTRFQVAETLELCGIPLSYDTLATKATRGGGPPFRIFGKSAVYQWADVVAWIRSAMGEPACTTSEHRARQGAPAPQSISPTKDGAIEALETLLVPIAEFPFKREGKDDEASKSVQLGRMLTGVSRAALMTAPMFAYTAPAPRTGKSKLVDIACAMSHGHPAPVIGTSSAPEELDKQLAAMIRGGSSVIALDNLDSDEPLASPLLCQILTQPTVGIRPFGQNEQIFSYPSAAVVSCTGNNLAVAKDLTERTLLCSLDAEVETPGSRKFNLGTDPVSWALENRVQMVRAALIILRAYVAAGRPPQPLAPMGGFEGWSKLVRSSLVWLGRADPCGTMDQVRGRDPGAGLHATIMDLWQAKFGANKVSAGDAVKAAKVAADGEPGTNGDSAFLDALWSTAEKGARNLPMALGRWLQWKSGVVLGGKRIPARQARNGTLYWVEPIPPKGKG